MSHSMPEAVAEALHACFWGQHVGVRAVGNGANREQHACNVAFSKGLNAWAATFSWNHFYLYLCSWLDASAHQHGIQHMRQVLDPQAVREMQPGACACRR